MQPPGDKFEILYMESSLHIDVLRNAGHIIYRANLKGSAPLFLTRAKNADGGGFWTSIPEGRQNQAEEIGKLIQEHITSQQ